MILDVASPCSASTVCPVLAESSTKSAPILANMSSAPVPAATPAAPNRKSCLPASLTLRPHCCSLACVARKPATSLLSSDDNSTWAFPARIEPALAAIGHLSFLCVLGARLVEQLG